MSETKFSILALLNNALEDFIKKGLGWLYYDYVNVNGLFNKITVLYRYQRGGRAKGLGLNIIRVRDLPFINAFVMLFKTVSFIRHFRPDVIRAYNPQLEGVISVISQFMTGVPSIVSIHNDYNRLVRERKYPAYIRLAVRIAQRFCAKFAREIWCITPYHGKLLMNEGASKEKVKIIYNKVKIDKFLQSSKYREEMRRELGVQKQFTVLNVGRLSVEKNLLTIIRAIALLREQGLKVKLILCGDQPKNLVGQPYKPILIEECKRLGIEEDVLFEGFIANEKLPKYYGAADVFVLIETMIGFGIVLVEAQASGLPIIASRDLGIKVGTIVDQNNSLLVNPTNHNELANLIKQLIDSKELRKKLSVASRKSARRFEWTRIAKLEAAFYRDVIKKSRQKKRNN